MGRRTGTREVKHLSHEAVVAKRARRPHVLTQVRHGNRRPLSKQRGPHGCPRDPRAASNLLRFRLTGMTDHGVGRRPTAPENVLFSAEALLHPFGGALAHFAA